MGISETSFKSYTKKEWLEFIQASMKNTSMEDHSWRISDELEGEAFAHRNDIGPLAEPILEGNEENPKLCLNYHTSYDFSNDVLKAFDAISLDIQNLKKLDQLSRSFPILIIRAGDLSQVKSIRSPYIISLLDCFEMDIHKIINLLNNDSNCKGLVIELPKGTEANQVMNTIGKFWMDFIYWIKAIMDEKTLLETLLQKIYFQTNLSSSFLYDLALLRAIKIVFYNIQNSMDLKLQACQIIVDLDYQELASSESDRLILGTVVSMAATLGGVKMLHINIDATEANPIEKVRLLRNIQLIMNNESNLSLVEDSIAGSYSIEQLSNLMANSIWSFIPSEL